MKQTAVEWLYEKLEYVNWMRNRDEISAGMADEWRKHYLEQAKAMELQQITDSYKIGARYALISQSDLALIKGKFPTPEQYYNETFKSE